MQQIGVYKLYELEDKNIIEKGNIPIGTFSIGCRDYNSKRAFWHLTRADRIRQAERIQEAREHNLRLLAIAKQQKEEQRDIQLLELVKKNKDVLSSVR